MRTSHYRRGLKSAYSPKERTERSSEERIPGGQFDIAPGPLKFPHRVAIKHELTDPFQPL